MKKFEEKENFVILEVLERVMEKKLLFVDPWLYTQLKVIAANRNETAEEVVEMFFKNRFHCKDTKMVLNQYHRAIKNGAVLYCWGCDGHFDIHLNRIDIQITPSRGRLKKV